MPSSRRANGYGQDSMGKVEEGRSNGHRRVKSGGGFTQRLGKMQEALGMAHSTSGSGPGRRRNGKPGAYDTRFVQSGEKINPQSTESFSSSFLIRGVVVLNVASGCTYMVWRFLETRDVPPEYIWWWWTFFMVEVFLLFAIWLGHTQRLFAVQRVRTTMDQIVAQDPAVGANAVVAILLPTAGERLDVVLKCLLGASSQRSWPSSSESKTGRGDGLRVIVLDEKRRKEVYMLTSGVHALSTQILAQSTRKILQAEGVRNLTPLAFYEWCHEKRGFGKVHIFKDVGLSRAVAMVRQMDDLVTGDDGGDLYRLDRNQSFLNQDLDEDISKSKEGDEVEGLTHGVSLLADESVHITPGFFQVFRGHARQAACMIYYSRKDAGTPRISPKAGNMNAAMFPMDDPTAPPLIGPSTIVVVNDARHQLQPEFLQRTTPYFFDLDATTQQYKWAKVAFVQTPQRFRKDLPDDPLGNHAASQYDVINIGKDGIGAVSSSGQGSLWRMEALRGRSPDGKNGVDAKDLGLVGKQLGFRAEMLIEDTHTSIDLFRQGWRSVYVNEPGEVLAWCTHQPTNLTWRIKQVLRWHQGAVQLLYTKGLRYTSFGGSFPTIFHRMYAFDQATYYLQAIPGYILLLMPVVYGVTGQPPFNTDITSYFSYFVPFIVTAVLPTVISAQWRSIDSHRLTRDEQTWLSTTYVQIYAFLQVSWTRLTRGNPDHAWVARVPTWPLTLVFAAQFFAIAGAVYWTLHNGFDTYYKNTLSICAGAFLGMFYLWPMMALQVGLGRPSFWFFKLGAYVVLGVSMVILGSIPGLNLQIG
ncbi:GT2 [Ectocarpus sp. CCAP 1310/34]|nr:GT2 [Ectocarpus sp. CCAP 1310/34]